MSLLDTRITSPDVRHTLHTALTSPGAMTHAWLFTGPPGAGRSVAAHTFAAALVCTTPGQAGCGECAGCRTALAGTHADILTIRPDGLIIPVAQVRATIENASRMPTTADWRVVIIEDADRLNDAGANALLKSIEEPPARTVFLLCAPSTDPADIHVTIRSRCRHVYVPTPTVEDIARIVESTTEGLTKEQVQWAASVCGGHVGRARRLATDPAARAQRQSALKVPEFVYSPQAFTYTAQLVADAKAEAEAGLAQQDAEEMAKLKESLGVGATGKGAAKAMRGTAGPIRELEAAQKSRRTRMVTDLLDLALMDISGLYRDALMVATGGQGNVVAIHPDHAATAAELARRISPERLLQCVDAVRMGRDLLAKGVRPEGALDAMVGRLRQLCVTGAVNVEGYDLVNGLIAP